MDPARITPLIRAQGPRTGTSCVFIWGALVVDGIIQLDDLPIHKQSIGDVHILLEDHAPKSAGHTGFPVPGRAIQEDGCPGIQGRSQLLKSCAGKHQL